MIDQKFSTIFQISEPTNIPQKWFSTGPVEPEPDFSESNPVPARTGFPGQTGIPAGTGILQI